MPYDLSPVTYLAYAWNLALDCDFARRFRRFPVSRGYGIRRGSGSPAGTGDRIRRARSGSHPHGRATDR